ncbi:MAG: class I tRNA ligase family protein, partial [Acidaminococcaceae bacterium]|nr:class I tRNA ligase family protein [Acidaminococcaceae bacterium]
MDDYSKTLNLPQTEFPMRAGLPEREPDFLKFWYDNDIYGKKQAAHAGCRRWVLHDGPPYANGRIHMGTALNKVLKDVVIKYKYARGYDTPYVPGWDTHGMPIEHAAIKELGLNREAIDALTLRKKCHEFALHWLDEQRKDFKRLGVLGDWDNPYVTLHKDFEAEQLRVFGTMAKKGYIYKGKKSVYWCPHCETALAEAEIEYAEQKTPTIFVKIPVADDKGKLPEAVKGNKVFFIIWTTTPWTMPANVAVALHPKYEYAFVECDGEVYVLAKDLLKVVGDACGKDLSKVLATASGKDLEYIECKHPFDYMDRVSLVINADYVTLDAGTGCVHIAPGHGVEDFEVGLTYKLPIICPVD